MNVLDDDDLRQMLKKATTGDADRLMTTLENLVKLADHVLLYVDEEARGSYEDGDDGMIMFRKRTNSRHNRLMGAVGKGPQHYQIVVRELIEGIRDGQAFIRRVVSPSMDGQPACRFCAGKQHRHLGGCTLLRLQEHYGVAGIGELEEAEPGASGVAGA